MCMGIEITTYRALYSKSIAGRGVARLISWLGPAESIEYLTVILEYIDLQFLLVGYSQLLAGPTLGYDPEMRHSARLQDFRSLLA